MLPKEQWSTNPNGLRERPEQDDPEVETNIMEGKGKEREEKGNNYILSKGKIPKGFLIICMSLTLIIL